MPLGDRHLSDGPDSTALLANLCTTVEPGQANTNAIVVFSAGTQLQLSNLYAAGLGRRAIYVGAASRVDVGNFRVEVWAQDPSFPWPAIESRTGGAVVANAGFWGHV